MPRAGAGPRSPLTLRSALSCLGLQGRGGQEAPPRPSGWAGAAPTRSRASTVVSGRQLGRAAGGTGTAGGAGPPQTNVAWCGLALGLAGPPGAGLRLGRSDAGDLLACGLRGPVRTPETLRPSLGAEPATRSTSMIVLTGRPRLLWAPPPVTGRRERLSPACPTARGHPGQEPVPTHLPCTDTGCGRGCPTPKRIPRASRPDLSLWARVRSWHPANLDLR